MSRSNVKKTTGYKKSKAAKRDNARRESIESTRGAPLGSLMKARIDATWGSPSSKAKAKKSVKKLAAELDALDGKKTKRNKLEMDTKRKASRAQKGRRR